MHPIQFISYKLSETKNSLFQVDLQAKRNKMNQGVAVVSPLKSTSIQKPSKNSMLLPLSQNQPFCPLPPPKKANIPSMMMTTFGAKNGNTIMVTSSKIVTSLDDKCTTLPVHHLDRINSCDPTAQDLARQRVMLMMSCQDEAYDETVDEVFQTPPPGGTKDLWDEETECLIWASCIIKLTLSSSSPGCYINLKKITSNWHPPIYFSYLKKKIWSKKSPKVMSVGVT